MKKLNLLKGVFYVILGSLMTVVLDYILTRYSNILNPSIIMMCFFIILSVLIVLISNYSVQLHKDYLDRIQNLVDAEFIMGEESIFKAASHLYERSLAAGAQVLILSQGIDFSLPKHRGALKTYVDDFKKLLDKNLQVTRIETINFIKWMKCHVDLANQYTNYNYKFIQGSSFPLQIAISSEGLLIVPIEQFVEKPCAIFIKDKKIIEQFWQALDNILIRNHYQYSLDKEVFIKERANILQRAFTKYGISHFPSPEVFLGLPATQVYKEVLLKLDTQVNFIDYFIYKKIYDHFEKVEKKQKSA